MENESINNSRKSLLLTILIAVIVAIIVGGAVYWWQQSINECNTCPKTTNKNVNLAVVTNSNTANIANVNTVETDSDTVAGLQKQVVELEQEIFSFRNFGNVTDHYIYDLAGSVGMKVFSNDEIGISFEYPESLGAVELNIRNGSDSGKLYRGTFANTEEVQFGGISEEFAEGRSGWFLDTQGYAYEDGTYYFKFVSVKDYKSPQYELEIVEKLTVDGVDVIILDGDSFIAERGADGPTLNPGEGNYGALINLNGDTFPGIGILVTDTDIMSLEQFKEMLQVISVSLK